MTRKELIKGLLFLDKECDYLPCAICDCQDICTTPGCAIIRAAAEELEKPEAKPSWIPVEEDAPPTSLALLLSVRDHNPNYGLYTNVGWKGASWHSIFDTPIDPDSITHWMYLPDPPEVSEDG